MLVMECLLVAEISCTPVLGSLEDGFVQFRLQLVTVQKVKCVICDHSVCLLKMVGPFCSLKTVSFLSMAYVADVSVGRFWS